MEKKTKLRKESDIPKQRILPPDKDSENMCLVWENVEKYESRIDIKMLLNNRITGFLPLQIQYIDERCIYSYSMKGLIPFEELLQDEKADFNLTKKIFDDLLAIMREGQNHFLEEEHFVLEPPYMYWNRRKRQLLICYYPGYTKPLDNQMVLFSQFLLKKIEHSDKICVSFLYGLYDLIEREGFTDTGIAAYLRKFREKGQASMRGERAKETERTHTGRKNMHDNPPEKRKRRDTEEQLMNLHILSKKEGFPEWIKISQDSFSIGRGIENDLNIPIAYISCFHARIDKKQSQFYITDLESTNGTYLNGKKLIGNRPVLCRENDVISFADFACRLERRQARKKMK